VLCGDVEQEVLLLQYRRAKPACLRPPPLLRCRTSVMLSRAPSEPRDDSHVLVERPACAYHRAKGAGVGAGAEVGVGCECRRKCSSPGQWRDQGEPVGHASDLRSMLSMQTRASMGCVGMADVFCNVVDEEGWW